MRSMVKFIFWLRWVSNSNFFNFDILSLVESRFCSIIGSKASAWVKWPAQNTLYLNSQLKGSVIRSHDLEWFEPGRVSRLIVCYLDGEVPVWRWWWRSPSHELSARPNPVWLATRASCNSSFHINAYIYRERETEIILGSPSIHPRVILWLDFAYLIFVFGFV